MLGNEIWSALRIWLIPKEENRTLSQLARRLDERSDRIETSVRKFGSNHPGMDLAVDTVTKGKGEW